VPNFISYLLADRCLQIIQSAYQTCAMFGTYLERVSTVFAHTGLEEIKMKGKAPGIGDEKLY